MPNDTPLSLEGAVGLLIEKNTTAPAADEGAKSATPAETPVEEDKDNPPADDGASDAPAADTQDTPADQGDVNGDGDEQGDALPPIEPPQFWKAEDKAAFKNLPRDAQEIIHRREQERDTELRNLQNRTSEQSKTVDAEVNRLKTLSDQISKHVNDDLTDLAKDFPEIKSENDLILLAQKDPARYSVFQARLTQFQVKQQAAAQAQQLLENKAQQERQEGLVKARDALIKAFPAWKEDPKLAAKEITEMQDYAISLGADPATARQAIDPIVYQLAQKAMLWDKAQEAKAKALVRTPPRVVKPGAANNVPAGDTKAKDRQTRLNQLTKSGDINDARGLLRA
jgi:hypothetical protein